MDYKTRTRISRILVDDAVAAGSDLIILGWVRTARISKAVAFVQVNDGSCVGSLQVVVENPESNPVVEKLLTGAAVRVTGKLVASQGQGQKFELKADSLQLVGAADETYPVQPKRHSFEFLRDIAHLRPRTNTFGAVNRIRSKIAYAIHQFYQERGFYYIHTPLITASDCEGAGDLFRVSTLDPTNPPQIDGQVDWNEDFIGTQNSLTVSGQLEGEVLATALGDIYTFGPTFRAENSNTSRHASEFWMIEPEMAWAEAEDRQNGGGDGRSGAAGRRVDRRLAARGALRRVVRADEEEGDVRFRHLLLVSRHPQIRFGAAFGVRFGIRAFADVPDRHGEHSRRRDLPACSPLGEILMLRAARGSFHAPPFICHPGERRGPAFLCAARSGGSTAAA